MVSPGLSNSFYGMHIWFLETGLVRVCLLFMAGGGDFGFPTAKKVPPSLPAKIKCPLQNIFCRKIVLNIVVSNYNQAHRDQRPKLVGIHV